MLRVRLVASLVELIALRSNLARFTFCWTGDGEELSGADEA